MNRAPSEIGKILKTVYANIETCIQQSPFNQNVRLVAVSKTKPVEVIKEAYDQGIRNFGENYVEEMVEKSAKLPQDIRWHFIGHLQTNKCKKVLIPNLEYLESIDSQKQAQKVNQALTSLNRKQLKIFLQIKTSEEDSKSGLDPNESFQLIDFIRLHCPNLLFSGLMTIGRARDLEAFKTLVDLRENICEKYALQRDSVELSMGMSGDYMEAIKYGATNVRVGSTIFGEREKKIN